MAKLVACSVVEQSEVVVCAGGAVLGENLKEGHVYSYYTNFCHLNAVSTQHAYPLPSIWEIKDERR